MAPSLASGGGGGGPSGSSKRPALSPRIYDPCLSALERLPLDLKALIVHCLPQEDEGALLSVSKPMATDIAPLIDTLVLKKTESHNGLALCRLLQKLTGLQELSFSGRDRVGRMLLQALADPSVGGQLRRLLLGDASNDLVLQLSLLLHGSAGHLPKLTELDLNLDDKGYSYFPDDIQLGASPRL